jgi:hypothetical protein
MFSVTYAPHAAELSTGAMFLITAFLRLCEFIPTDELALIRAMTCRQVARFGSIVRISVCLGGDI